MTSLSLTVEPTQASTLRCFCLDTSALAATYADADGIGKPKRLCEATADLIHDIFEGTAEIQQLVISRAISGMYIR